LQTVMNIARRYDHTRPITIANDRTDGIDWRHWDHYDLHCWNYGRKYIPAREMDPTKAVIISESASTLSTRGYYELPLPAGPTDFSPNLQVSSWDLNAPAWAEVADYDFYWQDQDRYVAGEFVWTGFDYLGEPTPYNDKAVRDGLLSPEQTARSSYFGIVDLCGIPKDRFWLYQTHWRPNDTIIHILPHWNWEEMSVDSVPVFVYTTGSCAELFLNGRSMGTRCKEPLERDNILKRYRLMWDNIPWEPGTIKAVAMRDGGIMGEASVKTAGDFSQLKLTVDRIEIAADGADLSYILVEAYDENGVFCPLENTILNVSVNGAGVLEGLCNGDPHSFESFLGNSMSLFYGKAIIVVRSEKGRKGKIEVKVNAGDTATETVEIRAF
jgi:beta-galactosidase